MHYKSCMFEANPSILDKVISPISVPVFEESNFRILTSSFTISKTYWILELRTDGFEASNALDEIDVQEDLNVSSLLMLCGYVLEVQTHESVIPPNSLIS